MDIFDLKNQFLESIKDQKGPHKITIGFVLQTVHLNTQAYFQKLAVELCPYELITPSYIDDVFLRSIDDNTDYFYAFDRNLLDRNTNILRVSNKTILAIVRFAL